MLKATAGGGGRGIRVVRDAEDLDRRLRAHQAGGRARLRQRRRLPGAPGHRRPARRGPGHRRRPGHGLGARGARLLGAAAQPEGDRGVRLAGARAGAGRASSRRRPSGSRWPWVPRRRHRRVPLPPRRAAVRLPRGQHAAAGRAPDHRGHHRRRPGQGAAPRGRPAGRLRPGASARPRSATPSRPGSTPRTPTATSPRRPAGSSGWRCPAGPGIRVDTGVSEGDVIPADFDSMIAKIIAYGRTRDEALGRLRRAVAETTVIIEGGATNKSFLLDLLDEPEVIDGSADTGWIDRVRAQGRLVSTRHSGVALAAAAIEAYEDEALVERQRLLSPRTAAARRSSTRAAGRSTSSCAAPATGCSVAQIGPHRFRVGHRAAATATSWTPSSSASTSTPAGCWSTASGSGSSPTRTGRSTWSRSTASPTGSAATRAACVRSPAPALVVATPLRGGRRGRGGRARARPGEHEDGDRAARAVQGAGAGVPGLRRQPGRDRRAAAAPGADRRRGRGRGRRRRGRRPASCRPSRPALRAEDRVARGIADLRSLLLGYDLDPRDERRVLVRLPGRAGRARPPARSRRRSSCCRCSPTCPS